MAPTMAQRGQGTRAPSRPRAPDPAGLHPPEGVAIADDQNAGRLSQPRHPAEDRDTHASGRTFGADHEHLPALAARHGGLVRRALRHDADVGGAVSGAFRRAANPDRADLGPVRPPQGDPGRSCAVSSGHDRHAGRRECHPVPDLPHGPGGGCRRHGAVARRGARHGQRRRGRLDDRLCHHGDEPGADDRPGGRRRAGRGLRLAGEFRPAAWPGAGRPGADLGRSGRNRNAPPHQPGRAAAQLSRPAALAPVLGLLRVPPPSARAVFTPISAGRPMSATSSSGFPPARSAFSSPSPPSATWPATSWPGAFRCGWG